MRIDYDTMLWAGVVVWLLSAFALQYINLPTPPYLWVFAAVATLLVGAYEISKNQYLGYAVVGLIAVYIIYVVVVAQLWLYLVAGVILLVMFLVAFEMVMGREWRRNPFAWLILGALIVIFAVVLGVVAGPMMILAAHIQKMRKQRRRRPRLSNTLP
jgi:uncharacterized integral membrane protein